MPQGTCLRPAVLAARQQLADGRMKLKAQHEQGVSGIEVCARLTDLLDAIVLELYQSALADLADESLESSIALVAHGGFGRRDVAPYSDVDLMLLHAPRAVDRVVPLARRLSQNIYDAGLQLGFSLRPPRQACRLASKDAQVFTSLVESRYLGGSVRLFRRFMHRFRRMAQPRSSSLIAAIERARLDERRKYGDVVYLLRPNVKRSRGGLRDLHMLRWIAFAHHGQCDPEMLLQMGVLPPDDHAKLRAAREFLLRLRNEIHFHAGKPQDMMMRHEQVRIAELFGYQGADGMLPVEQFMRAYFSHTSEVRYCVTHFLENTRLPSAMTTFLGKCLSHSVHRDFRVGPVHIGATKRGMTKLREDLSEVLRLMDLANRYNKRIDHATWQTIREAMLQRRPQPVAADVAERFMSLLSQSGGLAASLQRLHELRVLEQIVPAMKHARCLLQFNEYHKLTVDAHCIHAVECATEFRHRDDILGAAYRSIKNKAVLHLALLLHDLGKGYGDDHSEVGLRLARETAQLLQLNEHDSEVLQYLVYHHLSMIYVAFRRDLNDEKTILDFAAHVGSPDVLQMLFVHTCADLAAVGPDVLNDWKLNLLLELYDRTMVHFASDATDRTNRLLRERRETVRRLVDLTDDPHWWNRQLAALPRGYLFDHTPEEMVAELQRFQALGRQDAVAWGRYLEDRNVVEYKIGTHEDITLGIFHKLTGALTSKGLRILSADIFTLADKFVLDRFFVEDLDFQNEPPPERMDEVSQAMVAALKNAQEPKFRQIWNASPEREPTSVNRMPTRIRFDNDTSARFTIITIFAYDRVGLLYSITRTLFSLGLSVHLAKIGTFVDQVTDVFYVSDRQQGGGKIESERRLEHIRDRLMEAVDAPQQDQSGIASPTK